MGRRPQPLESEECPSLGSSPKFGGRFVRLTFLALQFRPYARSLNPKDDDDNSIVSTLDKLMWMR